jgi:hypothetical protein
VAVFEHVALLLWNRFLWSNLFSKAFHPFNTYLGKPALFMATLKPWAAFFPLL